MGLFNRNFDRPGPGVKKDEPRKKGIARFFELLTRDIGDLAKLNILFCLTVLPTAAAFVLSIYGFYTLIFLMLSLLLAFPVGGAIVSYVYYITRMMRDDPSYVWYEVKRKLIENFRQAAPIGMLCTAFIYAQLWFWMLLFGALATGELTGGIFWYLATLMAGLIFMMVMPYVFLHLAYIELKTFSILKNSILMSMAYFPRSLMGAITGSILWFVFILYIPVSMVAFPLIILIAVSISMLLGLMWVWPPFNKHFNIEETLIKRSEE